MFYKGYIIKNKGIAVYERFFPVIIVEMIEFRCF